LMDEFDLRKKANALKAELSIGKNAISEANVLELEKRLKKRELVKIRVLQSVQADRKRIAEKIAEDTNSKLVEVKGNTTVLWKKKGSKV